MELPAGSRDQLLQKLNAHHAAEESQGGEKQDSPQDASEASSSTADESAASNSELVLRLILQSGRFESEEAVSAAVDEYIGGKPLAYITGQCKNFGCAFMS